MSIILKNVYIVFSQLIYILNRRSLVTTKDDIIVQEENLITHNTITPYDFPIENQCLDIKHKHRC